MHIALVILIVIFLFYVHHGDIYTKEKGAQTKIYGPLSLALPSERSLVFSVLRLARIGSVLEGQHSRDPSLFAEITATMAASQTREPWRCKWCFSTAWQLCDAVHASSSGLDAWTRRTFLEEEVHQTNRAVIGATLDGKLTTIPAQSEVSACEKCRKAEVTQRETRQAERGTIGTRSGFTSEFQTISQCTFHDFKLLECTGTKPAIEPGDGTQEDGHCYHQRTSSS